MRRTPIRLILALFVAVLAVTALTSFRSIDSSSPPPPAPEILPPVVPVNYAVTDAAVAQYQHDEVMSAINEFVTWLQVEADRKAAEAEAAAAKKRAAAAAAAAPRASASAPAVSDGSVWDRLAQCESGQNWAYPPVSGGFSGGIMFHIGTWRAMGGTQYAPDAYLATREQQIAIAEKVLAVSGWGAWPGCSRKLGLR